MRRYLITVTFLIFSSLLLSSCGGGGGGSNPPGLNNGGGNNNPGGGAPGGGAVTYWYMSSGLGRDSQLGSVSCPTANLCFASGTNEILKSTDAGQSWTVSYQDLTRPSGGTFYLSGISFQDPLNGVANLSGSNPLVKTQDGGNTWTASNVLFGTSFSFADSKHGVSSELNLLSLQYTTDGGSTWPSAAITVGGIGTNLPGYFISKPMFIPSNSGNSSVGYAVAGKSDFNHLNFTSILLKTTDSGATWVDIPTTYSSQLFDVVTFIDSNRGWIGTFQGNVITTADGGGSWASHSIGNGAPVTAISCVGSLNCWVLAGSTIQASTNGGTTWTQQTPPAGSGYFIDYYDIHFTDAMHGIVLGYRYQTVGGPGSDFAAYTATGGF